MSTTVTTKKQAPRSRHKQPSVSRPQETVAVLNRSEALRLRTEGLSLRAIGRQLGVSHEAARQYVLEELEAAAQDAREQAVILRELEVARLERIVARWMPIATSEKLAVSSEVDGPKGPRTIEVPDYVAGTKAAEIVLKASARIAALYGLDGPAKVEHSGSVGMMVTTDLAAQIAAARAARTTQEPPSDRQSLDN